MGQFTMNRHGGLGVQLLKGYVRSLGTGGDGVHHESGVEHRDREELSGWHKGVGRQSRRGRGRCP